MLETISNILKIFKDFFMTIMSYEAGKNSQELKSLKAREKANEKARKIKNRVRHDANLRRMLEDDITK